MELLSLSLANCRNFSSKKLLFANKLTVIIGPNGSGKSNVLEAIALLCGVRSLKVETDLDLVKFGKSDAKIEAKVDESGLRRNLTMNILVVDPSTSSGQAFVKKAYFVDHIKKRFLDFRGHLSIIVFHPQDLDLVTGSPSLRRHHVDSLLALLDRHYWQNLSAYNKVISRRNKILVRIQEVKATKSELDFWDERLLAHGKFISARREEFFEFLALPSAENPLFKGLSWELKQSSISAEKLLRNRDRDITAGMTLSGPQRDDFRFFAAGCDLEYFGSRGEQRMAVLALKLAELEYFQLKMGSRPILALDDIFSELDWEHREAVLSIVGKQQTIITAAEEESVPRQLFKKAKVIELG